MRFGSVCSGIEAASVAWHPLGWQAAWLAEIEPFPSSVLKHHYPDVQNLGDMTLLPDLIRSGEVEAPDLFCGGTPCQAFSVAGLRRSLDDARGNLSLTFCEIANAIDSVRSAGGKPASIVFWENVPGVLSTKDNAFGCFLAGLAGEDDPLLPPGGKWTNAGCVLGPQRAVAWRVLDAQYFGVAQRRRRVFVVASARAGFDPAAVLFEFDGVRRDTAPSREAGKGTAHDTAPCLTSSGRGVERTGDTRGQDPVVAVPITMAHGQGGAEIGFDRGPTLTCNHEAPIAVFQQSSMKGRGTIGYDDSGVAKPVKTQMDGQMVVTHSLRGEGFDASEDGTGRGTPLVPVAFHPTQDPISSTGVCHAIGTGSGRGCATAAVAQPVGVFQDSEFGVQQYDSAGTLRAGRIPEHQMVMQPVAQPVAVAQSVAFPIDTQNMTEGHASGGLGFGQATDPSFTLTKGHSHAVATAMQVRRLTPVECERLQGFPDGYTAIPWRGKPASECPDGPRYKALGNSWAVPVVRWIGRRINRSLEATA